MATVKKLYAKLKRLKHCHFYADDWKASKAGIPSEKLTVGKKHTDSIENDNSSTRHHSGWPTRSTQLVSRSEESVYHAIELWVHAQEAGAFEFQRDVLLTLIK